jgi:ABC-type transport system involved in cytochrome bd biosynthesis fused ATPase/permease subunit
MQRPSPRPAAQKSVLPLVLAALMALGLAVVLTFLTLGFFSLVIGVVIGLFAMITLHWVTWGRWLTASLREELEAERQFQRAQADQSELAQSDLAPMNAESAESEEG